MNRSIFINQLENSPEFWDVIVIGGGATGLGVAVDAASRGYRTILLEQDDFSKGTSSRSTKLVHGGVRYLKQGNISLVLEALHERGLLMQNAPHLVSNQAFIVPSYDWWDGPFYGVGLKVYDLLAGDMGLGPSKVLSREEVMKRIPTLEPKGLHGGVIYYDGQFDDARLAVNLMQTIIDNRGVPLNYLRVDELVKSSGMTAGVIATDLETEKSFELNGRVVINATGVFTDSILKMDDSAAPPIISASQGVHIILDKSFLPGESAVMVPQTDDGRVLFAVPWHNTVVIGTTDTPIDNISMEPRALDEEIGFILKHAAQYLTKDPSREDALSVFAGLRPLVSPGGTSDTSEISRDHYLTVSKSGLVTIAGGKWTTYRKMAEDTVTQAALIAGMPQRDCVTKNLRVHGWLKNIDADNALRVYGSDQIFIDKLIEDRPELNEPIHADLPYIDAQVVWAVQREMARTVEDVLSRRTRGLLIGARASVEAAPKVAKLMADELGYDDTWQRNQVAKFTGLAEGYII